MGSSRVTPTVRYDCKIDLKEGEPPPGDQSTPSRKTSFRYSENDLERYYEQARSEDPPPRQDLESYSYQNQAYKDSDFASTTAPSTG